MVLRGISDEISSAVTAGYSVQKKTVNMVSQTCDICDGIVSGQLTSRSGVHIEPYDLETSAARNDCILCSVILRGLKAFLVDHGLPATKTTDSIFPDESGIVLYSPFNLGDRVIAKLRWMLVSDPVARTFRGSPQGFDIEFFTLPGTFTDFLGSKGSCILRVALAVASFVHALNTLRNIKCKCKCEYTIPDSSLQFVC